MLALSIGAWEVLQSKYFATLVSRQFFLLVDEKNIDSANVEWIGLQFFPPGIKIDGVELKVNQKSSTNGSFRGRAYIDKIKLQFDILNIFRNKISFKDIIISGGHIDLNIENQKDSGFKENLATISQWRKTGSKWVKNLVLKDVEFKVNKNRFFF